MSFDRIKGPDDRLADRPASRRPDGEEADQRGRAALFSASGATSAPDRPAAEQRGRQRPATSEERPEAAERPRTRRRPDVDVGAGEAPAASADENAGSDGAAEPPDDPGAERRLPSGNSLLQVECSHCGQRCPLPLGTAIKRAFPLALVNPVKSHPVFATCPCGERRTWLKPTLGLSSGSPPRDDRS